MMTRPKAPTQHSMIVLVADLKATEPPTVPTATTRLEQWVFDEARLHDLLLSVTSLGLSVSFTPGMSHDGRYLACKCEIRGTHPHPITPCGSINSTPFLALMATIEFMATNLETPLRQRLVEAISPHKNNAIPMTRG